MILSCKGWEEWVYGVKEREQEGLSLAREVMETAAFPLSSSTALWRVASLDLFWVGFNATFRDVREEQVLSSSSLHCPKQTLSSEAGWRPHEVTLLTSTFLSPVPVPTPFSGAPRSSLPLPPTPYVPLLPPSPHLIEPSLIRRGNPRRPATTEGCPPLSAKCSFRPAY